MRTETTPSRWAVAAACGWLAGSALLAEDINRVVLRVNDEIATLYDYELRKSNEIARLLADPKLDPRQRQEQLEQIGRQVMQSLFGELLMLSYADQHGIRVSDREVDDAIRKMQESQGIETREQLEQALASAGMTLEELRFNARRDLIWNQVIGQEVHSKIEIGEEEVRAYYRNNPEEFRIPEQRWLQEIIVLESSGLPDGELRRLAEEIHQRLAAGQDLESAAESYRKQEQTTGVIDLGWLRAEDLGEELAAAAWELAPGGYSPPVQARGGYHILHLVELREAGQRPFTEVQDQIMVRERGRRFNKELRTFIARLEQQAYIHENLPPEAVGYQSMAEGLELEDELEVFRAPIVETGEDDGEEEEPPAEPDDAGTG